MRHVQKLWQKPYQDQQLNWPEQPSAAEAERHSGTALAHLPQFPGQKKLLYLHQSWVTFNHQQCDQHSFFDNPFVFFPMWSGLLAG